MRRAALFALGAALLWAGGAAAADKVAIRAAPHPGYGRIVFDWPHPAKHTASLQGRTLTIRFARPFAAKLDRIAGALPGYVAGVTLASDGRTVRLALKGDYRLHSFDDHNAAVFDLRPAQATNKAVASPPGAGPRIAVRTGEHDGFGRLVFDWRTPVGVRVDQAPHRAIVRFDRAGRIDIERLRRRLPSPVTGVQRESGRGLGLAFTVPDGARLRHFVSGTSVVLDVLAPPPAGRAPARAGISKSSPAKTAGKPPARVLARPAAPARAVSAPEPPATAAPISLFPKPVSAAAEHRAIAREADGPKGAGLVSVDVGRGHGVSAFRFNWRRPVAAAVFRRRNTVWVTFDAAARIDVGALSVLGKPVVQGAAQVPLVGGTAVRMTVDPSYRLRVHAEDTVWVVEATSGLPRAGKPIAVLAQGSVVAGDARIVLPIEKPGGVLRLIDPDVGDRIDVVPVAASGRGVPAVHRFVDVTVLPSAQGIAVHPKADGVAVTAQPTGVTITRRGGLRLSSVADRLRAERSPPPPVERLFNLKVWAKGPGKTPAQSRDILTRRAAEAPPVKRTAARLRLARYFVAHGFGPEALGVLAQIAREAPSQAGRPDFRALRGAAHVLAGEYGPAESDLGITALANNVEAGPWRGAIAAHRGDWLTASHGFGELESVIGTYPEWLATRFGLLAAESSLAIGDTGTAQSRLDRLADRGLSGDAKDMLAVLQGYYKKDTGDAAAAIALWRQVAAHGDRRTSARARYALANVLLAKGEITRDQAIDRLERLRFAWRGDVYEFDLLRRLAALYAARDDSRDALETLKQAATYFHGIVGVQAVAKDMSGMFRHLFVDGVADRLPPVTALALYDEFRELTPPGPEGDKMVRKLADRLVSVDLLGEAARLLEQQVKFRLKGEEKAKVGARLARIRLLDHKPKDALAALDESAAPNLPPDLTETRRLARARAFAGLDRRSDALAVLVGDTGLPAAKLRAEMAWRAKDWPAAAAAFGALIARGDAAPNAAARARLVLSRAIALALAGDANGLAALRDAQGAMMAKTKYGDSFAAVVGPATPESMEAALRIAGDIGSVEKMLGETRADLGAARPAAPKTAIN